MADTQTPGLIQEQAHFLGQPTETLRSLRGAALYEALQGLGLHYRHYFQALDCNLTTYCAQEFGVDLDRISVERFFQSSPDAKWLFPDMVRESVLTGLRRRPVYPELIAGDEHIAGAAYSLPHVVEDADEESLRTVAEGGAIPESSITYGDRVVRLDKRGRGVLASYEVVRRMSVDMLRVHLERIGERLGRDLDARIVSVLNEGDGSAGSAPEIIQSVELSEWRYDDLIKGYLYLLQQHYFTPSHFVVARPTAEILLSQPEIKDATQYDFARTGAFPTPLGMRMVVSDAHPEGQMTVLDARYAVQKVTEQELMVESDKLIHQQWDRTYLSIVTDFAVLYEKARVVLDNSWN